MKKIFVVMVLSCVFFISATIVCAELPPQILLDMHMKKLATHLKAKEYKAAAEIFIKTDRLQQEKGLTVDNGYYYYRGETLYHVGKFSESYKSLEKYLKLTGTTGRFYDKSLTLLPDVMEQQEKQKLREIEIRELNEKMIAQGPGQYADPISGMKVVFIQGGCYQMGDTFDDGDGDEKPVHKVCVDDFYMGKYEVTQKEYKTIMGSNPSTSNKGDRYPVEMVSWDDAQDFIKKLNSSTGLKYRLPTEAEWEYAARSGGKKERYAGSNSPGSVAWFADNSGKSTHRVGTKSPNGLGLYDMSGNVWEWCQDWYGENYYGNSPVNNPAGPMSGSSRVFRGGSCYDTARVVRSAFRCRLSSGDRYDLLGFRLVLSGQ